MCGRVTVDFSIEQIDEMYKLYKKYDEATTAAQPRYNVAPSQDILIVRQDLVGTRELVFTRWGLIPAATSLSTHGPNQWPRSLPSDLHLNAGGA